MEVHFIDNLNLICVIKSIILYPKYTLQSKVDGIIRCFFVSL